ncbi:hypothetical protein AJ78_00094 [Emergomyces pasteurianus Ep9510]|uniref:Uncharacterized protein n=1 Tax=Emergomyces pasteurianus Ep9510 TaxID=1447872 RepID=A0A1J9QVL3_9EURO|nr:hypothetical protein AJ78_00094 [Emergomyces pasteurianus Ep9510]
MTGYPISHEQTFSGPADVRSNACLCLKPLEHNPTLNHCEAVEKRQSVWSVFWLEERLQPHVSTLCAFARLALLQLSGIKRKIRLRIQSGRATSDRSMESVSPSTERAGSGHRLHVTNTRKFARIQSVSFAGGTRGRTISTIPKDGISFSQTAASSPNAHPRDNIWSLYVEERGHIGLRHDNIPGG